MKKFWIHKSETTVQPVTNTFLKSSSFNFQNSALWFELASKFFLSKFTSWKTTSFWNETMLWNWSYIAPGHCIEKPQVYGSTRWICTARKSALHGFPIICPYWSISWHYPKHSVKLSWTRQKLIFHTKNWQNLKVLSVEK